MYVTLCNPTIEVITFCLYGCYHVQALTMFFRMISIQRRKLNFNGFGANIYIYVKEWLGYELISSNLV